MRDVIFGAYDDGQAYRPGKLIFLPGSRVVDRISHVTLAEPWATHYALVSGRKLTVYWCG